MDDARGLTRRTAIALGSAGAFGGVMTLAGCTTGGGSSSNTDGDGASS